MDCYDGALSDTVPIQKAFDAGGEKVILLLTKPQGVLRTSQNDKYLARLIQKKYPISAQQLRNRAKRYNSGLALAKQYEAEGLLFHYKPTNAVVTVDGQKHTYKKVWLAPTMNGRYYGGGMMPTPAQNRKNTDGTVSAMVMYGAGKLKTLAVFPSIFKGEHVRHEEMVDVLTGHTIRVEFDRPTPLQIDGETIPNVTSYEVTGGAQ